MLLFYLLSFLTGELFSRIVSWLECVEYCGDNGAVFAAAGR